MRSICFFASYFTSKEIPYYIQVYLKELKRQFSEVVLYTSQNEINENSLDFLKKENIQLKIESNTGFDFGMWYKAFQSFDVSAYDQIALVNDSCVLFKSLDEFMKWSAQDKTDFKGITYSNAISPHVQSYFILLNKNAVKHTSVYFKQHGIFENIKEVIQKYEIGLSTFLLSQGLKMSAYMDNNGYEGEFSPYYYCIDYHLSKGIPLIKKKILFASYRQDELFTLARMNFNVSAPFYIDKIKNLEKNVLLDFSKLKEINLPTLRGYNLLKYRTMCVLVKLVRSFKGSPN